MENGEIPKFDLQALLKMSSLDLRRVPKSDPTIQVDEYFRSLSRFLGRAHKIIETISRISTLEADESDYLSMTTLQDWLENIGCSKFTPSIDEIISAGKRGHNGFASDCAWKILDEFKEFCALITAAKKTDKDVSQSIPEDLNPETAPAEDNGNQPLKTVLQALEHEESTRKLKILAIDDAPIILQTISSALNSEYKVYGMTDPMLLEKFLDQITPELFLLDYKMPKRSGFEVVPIIRHYEKHKDTPIIFLTSLGTADHVSAAFALGACDFIVKPFQEAILREKIAKHIVRKKLF